MSHITIFLKHHIIKALGHHAKFRGDINILLIYLQTFHKSSQDHLKKSVTQFFTFADASQNWLDLLPINYIVVQYPQQMVQMAFCDLLHTFHKQITYVSQYCFCHPTVGNFASPLKGGLSRRRGRKWIRCNLPALPRNS